MHPNYYTSSILKDMFDSYDEKAETTVENFMKEYSFEKQQNNPNHVGSVGKHTFLVIKDIVDLAFVEHKTISDALIIAALYHDVGKADAAKVNPKTGYDQFLNHAAGSVEIMKQHADNIYEMIPCTHDPNFAYLDKEYCKAMELVALHDTKYSKQGKVKTMLDAHDQYPRFAADLLTLQMADIAGQSDLSSPIATVQPKSEKYAGVRAFAELILATGTPEQTEGVAEVIEELDRRIERQKEIEALPSENDEKVFLARTASGKDIYISAETAEHMKAHPDVSMAHMIEAIGTMENYEGPFSIGSVDLNRVIGVDNCVEVQPGDEPHMLYRKGRDGQTPILLNGRPAETSLITIGLCLDDDGKHTLFTSFYGQLAPKEPWDPRIKPEEIDASVDFWNTHALVAPSGAIDWERSIRDKEQIEIFSYAYDHTDGDQCWTDHSKYFYCPETKEIIEKSSCGWTLDDTTTIISKDRFFEIVDEVQKGAEDYQANVSHYRDWHLSHYEIYTDLSDDNRKMISSEPEIEISNIR